jgi:hypothetical protein
MKFVIGGVFAVMVISFAIAAIRGRVRARSCCTPVAPGNDARMKA